MDRMHNVIRIRCFSIGGVNAGVLSAGIPASCHTACVKTFLAISGNHCQQIHFMDDYKQNQAFSLTDSVCTHMYSYSSFMW